MTKSPSAPTMAGSLASDSLCIEPGHQRVSGTLVAPKRRIGSLSSTRGRQVGAAALVATALLTLTACASSGTEQTASDGGGSVSPVSARSAAPAPTSAVAAVIGGWAARYGAARNAVLSSVEAFAAVGGADDLEVATADTLAALKEAAAVPPSPDAATEQAYRAALQDLTARVAAVRSSGDVAAARALADQSADAFRGTEQALAGAYS